VSRLLRSPKLPWFMPSSSRVRVPRYRNYYVPAVLKPKSEQLVQPFFLPYSPECVEVELYEVRAWEEDMPL
jgi:hypothetical protein